MAAHLPKVGKAVQTVPIQVHPGAWIRASGTGTLRFIIMSLLVCLCLVLTASSVPRFLLFCHDAFLSSFGSDLHNALRTGNKLNRDPLSICANIAAIAAMKKLGMQSIEQEAENSTPMEVSCNGALA
nr:hypothetical protein Iba_chr13aCG7500 [Ipomoea batatas]